jgi:hypothetical protein
MTESFFLKSAAQRALTALENLRGQDGLWRYGLRSDVADASLTFWAAMPLVCAGMVNEAARRREVPPKLVVDERALESVRTWLDEVMDLNDGTIVEAASAGRAPDLPGGKPGALTAFGALLRLLAGESTSTSPSMKRTVTTVLRRGSGDGGPADSVTWCAGGRHAGAFRRTTNRGDVAKRPTGWNCGATTP